MKHLVLVFSLCLTIAHSQIQTSIYPDVAYSDFEQIEVEGSVYYTFGSCNVFTYTTDAGANWFISDPGDDVEQIAILPNSNAEQCFVLSESQLQIFNRVTQDYTQVAGQSEMNKIGKFRGILERNSVQYLFGSNIILQRNLGESEWSDFAVIDLGSNDRINEGEITENFIFIGSFDGKIREVSLADGSIRILPSFGGRISDIVMVDDDLGYVRVSGEVHFYRTENGWLDSEELSGMPESVIPIAVGPDVLISANTNRMYVSTDGGQSATYTPYLEDGSMDLVEAAFVDSDNTIYLAGRSSTLISTKDLGVSFTNHNDYNREHINAISILPGGKGHAVGSNGYLLETNNGGQDWSESNLNLDPELFYQSILTLETGEVLIGGGESLVVYKNGNFVAEHDFQAVQLIYYNEASIIYASSVSGSLNTIYKSADAGLTWEAVLSIATNAYSGFSVNSLGDLFLATGSSLVYFSMDQGETWEELTFDRDEIRLIQFFDREVGIFVSDGDLYKTTTFGASSEILSTSFNPSNLHILSRNHLSFTSSQNAETRVFYSNNSGETLNRIATFCSSSLSTDHIGDGVVFLGQRGGHINSYEMDLSVVDADSDGFNSDEDCDDTNDEIFPGAFEIVNNLIDEDCDGIAQMIDTDNDGFNSDEDCNDDDPAINPDADEVANNDIDENCDGELLVVDTDNDGFNSDEDCNDEDASINPDAEEIANNDVDEDCDGVAQVIDADNDGFNSDDDCNDDDPSINPDAEEIANNGVDENCDGSDLMSSTSDPELASIRIFPNPASSYLMIRNPEYRTLDISVNNLLGRRALHLSTNETSISLDATDLTAGIYIIDIRDENGKRRTEKVVVNVRH